MWLAIRRPASNDNSARRISTKHQTRSAGDIEICCHSNRLDSPNIVDRGCIVTSHTRVYMHALCIGLWWQAHHMVAQIKRLTNKGVYSSYSRSHAEVGGKNLCIEPQTCRKNTKQRQNYKGRKKKKKKKKTRTGDEYKTNHSCSHAETTMGTKTTCMGIICQPKQCRARSNESSHAPSAPVVGVE